MRSYAFSTTCGLSSSGIRSRSNLGLTLIELLVTLIIIAVSFVLVGSRLGIANYWSEEAFLRKIRETITFLHQQAVVDQIFYQLQIDFEKQEYQVFAMNVDRSATEDPNSALTAQQDVGYLTQELAQLQSPAIGQSYDLIPPPAFPSLGEPIKVPGTIKITSVKTARGNFDAKEVESAYILFSPRGFSEFAVIQMDQGPEGHNTILVNPFTGSASLFREEKDFDWTYGRENQS
jgi:prepilin-type N-terminal cleavage/methylation domain-containing protein